ncbi:conserved hypothetical protein [Candidatus Terasakiella magnetica]|uniref:Bbp19-like phage domain-containing protein n=1 Tax=Candidatus Terasakiella magnetica TaxID=1867952 RepID=A0A1C3RDM6_9PROT|nr:hypothetical protein [Candidatus Terasakiella magnetica]SCA55386.1 conserved hypothetical protein [Candidatus Terasakiella magnetica]
MSNSSDPGWGWFEKAMSEEITGEAGEDVPARFARCFSGVDGEAALSHLAEMTLARPLGANAHNGILRHLEGQRYLVSYIMGLVRQGREGK